MQATTETDQSIKQTENQKRSLLYWMKLIPVGILLILCALAAFKVCSFLFRGGLITSSIGDILSSFWWMFKKVFFATIPFLIPPVLAAAIVYTLSVNKILRFLMGVGSVYLFYLFSGSITFSTDGALSLVRLAFQIYFLILLVIPDVFINVVSAIVCVIGSIVIFIFPDLPGFIDDMAAICVLITMVSAYMNTLAMFVKKGIDNLTSRIWA